MIVDTQTDMLITIFCYRGANTPFEKYHSVLLANTAYLFYYLTLPNITIYGNACT